MRYLLLPLCLLFLGCAHTGAQLSAPVYKTLDGISANATSVYGTGAQPKDKRVEAIVIGAKQATIQVKTLSNAYDSLNAKLLKAQHINHIFYGICFGLACLIAVPIVMKVLPLLAL